jgi:hypothetical protein
MRRLGRALDVWAVWGPTALFLAAVGAVLG